VPPVAAACRQLRRQPSRHAAPADARAWYPQLQELAALLAPIILSPVNDQSRPLAALALQCRVGPASLKALFEVVDWRSIVLPPAATKIKA
jgi:hypothetical protein